VTRSSRATVPVGFRENARKHSCVRSRDSYFRDLHRRARQDQDLVDGVLLHIIAVAVKTRRTDSAGCDYKNRALRPSSWLHSLLEITARNAQLLLYLVPQVTCQELVQVFSSDFPVSQ
jgi:hypothetical protein